MSDNKLKTAVNDPPVAKLVGIIGMSGSGKTTLIKREFKDFMRFDDIGLFSPEKEPLLLKYFAEGKPIVVSDIEFCRASQRNDWEHRLGIKVDWICFENEPWKCAINCLYRVLIDKKDRNLREEVGKIIGHSRAYQPFGKTHPVKNPDSIDAAIKTDEWRIAENELRKFYLCNGGILKD